MESYRTFLKGLLDGLVDAIQEAENLGWHHEQSGSPMWEYTHYLRLKTWCEEVDDRLKYYDYAKGSNHQRVWTSWKSTGDSLE